MSKVKGTNVEGRLVTLHRSQPKQLSLFGTFVPEADKYSNTIELYDAIPKYFASTKQMEALREGGKYLPTLQRQFKHKGDDYAVTVMPARMRDRQGREREFYPTQREELVEEALKKIACDQLNGVYLDNFAGVQFTLYELRQELKNRGHEIHFHNLIEALTICNGAQIVIHKGDDKVMRSPIFPVMLIASRKDWLKNPKQARCYVQFNPLVTNSINQLTYRQFDYSKFMEHSRQLTRWLHKRLSHNYLQADFMRPYHINLSTIIRDSGLVNAKRMNDNMRQVDSALEELRERDVLGAIQRDVKRGANNRIEDVTYNLHPDPAFVEEIKRANQRNIVVHEKAEKLGIRPEPSIDAK